MEHWRETDEALLLVVPIGRAKGRVGGGDFGLKGDLLHRGGGLVYTGAQMMRLDVLECIDDTVFSLNVPWDELISRNRLRGVVYPGIWRDIGTPEGLEAAHGAMGAPHV